MPQFDPQYFASQIFWLAVMFTLLYMLLTRLAIPRIAGVLEERAGRISEDLERAEATRKEAEAVIEAYEAALAKARGEAATVLARTSQELAEESARRQAEFGAELAARIEAAEARIAAARDAAKAELRDSAADVARDIVAKLGAGRIDDDALAGSVDAALRETA